MSSNRYERCDQNGNDRVYPPSGQASKTNSNAVLLKQGTRKFSDSFFGRNTYMSRKFKNIRS